MGQQLQHLWHRYKSVLAYLFFGGLTTVVNYLVFWIFNMFCSYLIANTFAWFLSVLFAYVTNKLWVFDAKTPTVRARLKEATSFFGFRLLSYFVDTYILFIRIIWYMHHIMIIFLVEFIC